MTLVDEAYLISLMEYVIRAVTAGILAGVLWSAVFRIKARPGS